MGKKMNRNKQTITKHAETRMQQRGIKEETINLIRDFGEGHYRKGAWRTCFNNRSYKEALSSLPGRKQELDKARKFYIVEIDGVLITAAPITSKLKRNCKLH